VREATVPRRGGKRRPSAPAAVVAALVATLALSGCGANDGEGASSTTAPEPTSTTTEAATSTTSADEPRDEGGAAGEETDGACPDADAVADLVGQAVDETSSGGGESSTGGPSVSYSGCGYRLADGQGEVGVQRVTVDDDGGLDGLPFEVLDAQAQAEADLGSDPEGPPTDGTATYEGVSIGELAAFDTGSALVVDDDPEHPLRITTEELELDPASAAALRLAVAELVVSGGDGG
jgi:hypothetical protein